MLAVQRLGLNSLGAFNPREKVIEYMLRREDDPATRLVRQPVRQFVRDVAARTSAPGGGSVAALVGSLVFLIIIANAQQSPLSNNHSNSCVCVCVCCLLMGCSVQEHTSILENFNSRILDPVPISSNCTSQGAALTTMAALLTYGNRKYEHLDAQLRAVLPKLHDAYEHMLPLVDRDTLAFTNYIVRTLLNIRRVRTS